MSALEAKRNCKRYSGSHFIDVVTIGQRVSKGDIEGELVADLPNQSDQRRKRLAMNRRCRSKIDRHVIDPPTDIAECDLCLKL